MTDPHASDITRPVVIGDHSISGARLRLARVRPEHASLYEGLDAGAWYPAASLAAYYRSWLARHPDRTGSKLPLGGLDTSHFEFRGGVPRDPPWLPGQSAEERAKPVRG